MGNKHDKTSEDQSLKDKLLAIILLETSKDYKKMDSDLVTECVDFLMELEGAQRLTKEEIKQRVNDIPFKGKVTALKSYAKKKLRTKRIVIIAAVLAVIITLLGILAIGTGDAITEFFRKKDDSIHEFLASSPTQYGNITFYKADVTKEYSSLEDFAKSEGIEVLYPTWLPKDEKIVKIRYLVNDEKELYVFQTQVPDHSISIAFNGELDEDFKLNCEHKEVSGLSVYYEEFPEYIQAEFIYKNNCYWIKSDTEENLFKIIKNLKEFI